MSGGTLVLALLLLTLAGGRAMAEPLKLTVPYNSLSYDVAPLWVAIDEGLFRRYGVDVTPGGATKSTALVASLLSGEQPVAICGPDAVVSADLNGADIVIIAAGPRADFTVVAKKSIHRIADFKGKKIGITNFGTTHDFLTRYVLPQAGIGVSEVTLVPLGQAGLLPALVSSTIDGAIMQANEIVAARKYSNLTELAKSDDYPLFLYAGSLIGKKSWLAAHREAAMDLVKGYVAGSVAIRNDKASAIRIIAKYSGEKDKSALEWGYEELLTRMPRVPIPDAKYLQADLDESPLPSAKTANPAEFIDPSYVAALERDGFVNQLSKVEE
jgi:NitT/TauT family transport system substrate-binding protein